MKIMITGAKGQLGSEMVQLFSCWGYDVYGLGREELDFTKLQDCQKVMREIKPDVVVHSGAYTNVDLAESEQDSAFLVNAIGTRNIAIAAGEVKAKLVYISTDYVFNSKSRKPIHEFSSTNPINIYGLSKLAGEQFIQSLHNHYFIVRTSWVYGNNGQNFVKTMLNLSKTQSDLKVVDDQIGTPTYTTDLIFKIEDLIKTNLYGIYHISNSGSCSWFEFAKEIFKISNIEIELNPCKTEEFPRPALRPNYSVMDHMSLRLNSFSPMRHWREALQEFLLKSNEKE